MVLVVGFVLSRVFETVAAAKVLQAGDDIVPSIDNPLAVCSCIHTPD